MFAVAVLCFLRHNFNLVFILIQNLSDGIRELSIKQRLQEYLQVKTDEINLLSKEKFISIFKVRNKVRCHDLQLSPDQPRTNNVFE